jgi:hypothetical protein
MNASHKHDLALKNGYFFLNVVTKNKIVFCFKMLRIFVFSDQCVQVVAFGDFCL